jgi:hypothetical protein
LKPESFFKRIWSFVSLCAHEGESVIVSVS